MERLAVATIAYESAHQRFPPGKEINLERQYTHVGPLGNHASFLAYLLPNLDGEALYDMLEPALDTQTPDLDESEICKLRTAIRQTVKVFRCPSDREKINMPGDYILRKSESRPEGESLADYAPTNYVGCIGNIKNGLAWPDSKWAKLNGMKSYGIFVASDKRINGRPRGRKPDEIADGLSKTLLLSECKIGDPWVSKLKDATTCTLYENNHLQAAELGTEPRGFSWYYAQTNQAWTFSTLKVPNETLAANHECVIDDNRGVLAARSRHRNCVNVAFADGSVQSKSSGIGPRVWMGMGAIADGLPAPK